MRLTMRSVFGSRFRSWLSPLVLLLIVASADSQPSAGRSASAKLVIPINTGWRFREAGKDSWHTATVPGCVHTDLLTHNLIDDPFYRDNEQKQQWIGKTDWEYEMHFTVAREILQREHIELVFEGLDTYAGVYLNETLVLNADNMFRTWRVDCKRALKIGDNTLRVHFRSPINEILPLMAKMKYQLPAPNDQGEKTSPYTRKAPYQYGWDWGPRFVTSGLWRPVSLEALDTARVSNLRVVQNQLDKTSAQLTAEVEVVSTGASDATVLVEIVTDGGSPARKPLKLPTRDN